MIHAYAKCPDCGEEINEMEDDWFYCDDCEKSWWWDRLVELGCKPAYPLRGKFTLEKEDPQDG